MEQKREDFRLEASKKFAELIDIMDELRAKCPWDKSQTFDSIRPLTIEETYELADAIARGEPEAVRVVEVACEPEIRIELPHLGEEAFDLERMRVPGGVGEVEQVGSPVGAVEQLSGISALPESGSVPE